MRTYTTFGIIAVALTLGLMWPSEANAQFRPRPGVHALGPQAVAPQFVAPRAVHPIGGYARPITPAAVGPRFSAGLTVYPQFSGYGSWNFNQYAPFFQTYGYGYGTYPVVVPIRAYAPYYGYGYGSYYGNGYYYGY